MYRFLKLVNGLTFVISYFTYSQNWSSKEVLSKLSKISLQSTIFNQICMNEPNCKPNKYRSVDGSCNNIYKSWWGQALSGFSRLIGSSYADLIDKPRVASDGSQLPNVRLLSSVLASDMNRENMKFTVILMQFGQFIDHDLTRTTSTRTYDNKEIKCCSDRIDRNPELQHPSCLAIRIPENDMFYKKYNQKCMEFVRSAVAPRHGCGLGPREQLNQLSSYIDGGMIYGSTDERAESLRQFSDGRLRTSTVNHKEFLPYQNDSSGCSIPEETKRKCFLAGDGRANEVLDLVVLQAIWLKEHNRIAGYLKDLNNNWNDEQLYQETRRIVIAQLQHIVYNEFLPLIIGQRMITNYGLRLKKTGFSYDYSITTDATVMSSFATAAYRFHTIVPSVFNLHNSDNEIVDQIPLHNTFFDPTLLYKKGTFDMLVKSLTNQPIQKSDNYFTRELTNHLFQAKGDEWGLDLISINLQRGRDHGIPGYNAFRKVCGLTVIKSFHELELHLSNPLIAKKMSQLYKTVDDIDLFIAGVSEKLLSHAITGPTFACIIGEQFRRIKVGDRFWYENGDMDSSFTLKQLREIRKTSLARIICDNTDIKSIQPFVMVQASDGNPYYSCDNDYIPSMDLNAWTGSKAVKTVQKSKTVKETNTDRNCDDKHKKKNRKKRRIMYKHKPGNHEH